MRAREKIWTQDVWVGEGNANFLKRHSKFLEANLVQRYNMQQIWSDKFHWSGFDVDIEIDALVQPGAVTALNPSKQNQGEIHILILREN
jgi:hypothetical protein